jgi:hypothetical protein
LASKDDAETRLKLAAVFAVAPPHVLADGFRRAKEATVNVSTGRMLDELERLSCG